MSNLLRCFGFTENKLHLGQKQCKAVCPNEQSASLLSSLELSHVLQYAPSFSLSAPCILLTLTHRLRFIQIPILIHLFVQKGLISQFTSVPQCAKLVRVSPLSVFQPSLLPLS